MEAVNRAISETKKLALEENESKTELSKLNVKLSMEEKNLSLLNKEIENLYNDVTHQEEILIESKTKVELINTFRESYKGSYLLLSFMKKFIENTDPKNEDQYQRIMSLQVEYTQLIKKYEENPIYQNILREASKEKELAILIQDKRNETMKLDTERSGKLESSYQ